MASSTANASVAPPPVAQDRRHTQVIERQLSRARFHVKLVDFLVHVALLAVVALGYLLLAAIADHWLLPSGLGFTGRTLAFVGLLVLLAWFAGSYLLPLLFRGINPTYAARTIEEAQPSLKNSLINFLLLRQDRGGIREAVFEAVEQKAASDIAAVHVESAVDRSPMIRVGYVLVGVLALCAAYKILSPKDPFQSAARVALPWADIARPSRVQILEVKPGSTKVYHGHTVEVTATIDGTSEDSPVWLIYSTADGQTVDRKLRMKSRPGGIQFEAVLPPEEETSLALKPGLQQDVTYRVEAGDAVTEDYRLTLVAAPTIVVQQLEFEFPAYTGKPRQTRDRQGDIQAIEGTKVTVHAAANQPIVSAYLEFDPDPTSQRAAQTVPLEFEGQRAWGTITLKLNEDRRTPWHTSYQVRFVNADGNTSEQPIRHQIDVLRDLPPEVQILAPTQKRIELPENGSLPMEVRAIDPDFGLTAISLHGQAGGKQVLKADLLPADGTSPPQAVAKYVLRPQELGLKVGDELLYEASAADNRMNANGEAEPNITTTSSQVIVIIPPQEQPQNQDMPPPEGDPPPRDQQKQDDQQQDDQKQQGDKQRRDQPQAGDQKQPQDQPQPDQSKTGDKSQSPMDEQANNQSKQGEKSDSPMPSKGDKGQSSSDQKNNQGGNAKGQQADGQSEQQQSEGASDTGSPSKGQSGSGKSGEKSAGSPQQENPADGAAGEKSDGDPSGAPSGNADQPAGRQGGQSGNERGDSTGAADQPAKPAHEGDAIEEILKHRREKEGENPSQPRDQRDGSGQPPADATDAPQEGDPQTPMPGEKTGQKQRGSADQKNDGQGDAPSPAAAKGEKGTQTGSPADARKSDAQSEKSAGQKGAQPDQKDDASPDAREKGATGANEKDGESGTEKQGAKGAEKQGAKGVDKNQGEGATKNKAGGEGGDPQGPMKRNQQDEPQPGADPQGEPKDPGMSKSGDSGAGQSTKDDKGSGDSQEAGRDRDKKMLPDENQRPEEADPSTPSGSKRQSDSKGNDSGDRDGGGKQGAGQPSNQQGNDSAGKNSPGDEGAGTAQEKGQGPTGKKGGDQQKAGGQTGAKGQEKGEGSSGKTGQGDSAGGGPMPPDSKSQDAKNDGSPENNSQGTGGNVPLGGGNQDQRPPSAGGEVGEVPDSDDANLDYAKKQTELALEHLKDQEHNPDPELLDRLGWTPEEMQEFIRRWEALQKAAAEDPQASRELDESLKSLGLRPPHTKKRTGGDKSDSVRDLRDSGTRSSAPKSYREQFDNFRKSSR